MLQLVKTVNTETGEVVSNKQKYFADVLNEDGYKVPPHKLGAKLFANVAFPKEMTDGEIGKMTKLSKLMISTSNMLGYRTRSTIKPYTEKEIIEIVKLSNKRGKEFLTKMIKLRVMQIVVRKYGDIEISEYYINPAYFFAGRRISLNLYLLFREHLDQILPKWVRIEFLLSARKQKKS